MPSHRSRIHALLLAALAGVVAAPRLAIATTILVDSTADDRDLGSNGNCTLREALIAANQDVAVDACPAGSGRDVVELPAGTYPLTIQGLYENAARVGDLDVTAPLTVHGAGADVTVVDAKRIDGVWHVLASALAARLEGITIRGALGSGIVNAGAVVELVDCRITDNQALAPSVAAGAIDALAGTVTVTGARIDHNGGTQTSAVRNPSGTVEVTDSAIEDNHGGYRAISNAGSLTITRVGLSRNEGSAIGNTGELTIEDSTLEDQTSVAIYNADLATIRRTTFARNAAGGLANYSGYSGGTGGTRGEASIEGSSFVANGHDNGFNLAGGISTYGQFYGAGLVTVRNTTFSANAGPAIYAEFGTTVVVDASTIVGGPDSVNVLLAYNDSSASPVTVTFRNSILVGACLNFQNAARVSSDGGNLESPGQSCIAAVSAPDDLRNVASPGLGPLALHGQATETHALLPGSPAIDSVAVALPCSAADQNGRPRPRDGNGDGLAACDRGAVEACDAAPGSPDGDGDGIPDDCDVCPAVQDGAQADSDGDGVGDACDNCPDAPNPDQTDGDGDGAGNACDGSDCGSVVDGGRSRSAIVALPLLGALLAVRALRRARSRSRVVLVVFVLGLGAGPAHAATIVVDALGDDADQAPNGNCTLREAIAAANGDTSVDGCAAGSGSDQIALPAGTIVLSISGADEDGNATGDLDLTASVELVGAGSSATAIDGQAVERILHIRPSALTVRLTDLALTGSAGAALRIAASSVALERASIRSNGSYSGEGAVVNDTGDLSIRDSELLDNRGYLGGGISNRAGLVSVTDSELSGNQAYGYGGALVAGDVPYPAQSGECGAASVVRTRMSENGAYAGGAIYGLNASVTVEDSRLELNLAAGAGGGAIHHVAYAPCPGAAGLTIRRSTLVGNSGVTGGAIYDESGNPVFVGESTLSGNRATDGGAIANLQSGFVTLQNSTLSGNQASDRGGALFGWLGGWSLVQATVAANTALHSSAIFLYGDGHACGATAVTVANSVILGECSNFFCGGGFASVGGNLESPGDSCGLTHASDLRSVPSGQILAPLAANGGPTATQAPYPTSPVVDSARPEYCAPTDQRGRARPLDGDRDGQTGCDRGAVELCTTKPGDSDGDGDDVPDPCDVCPARADASQADQDADGVGDACDDCPLTFDPDQTDTDGDGTGNACDTSSCASVPGSPVDASRATGALVPLFAGWIAARRLGSRAAAAHSDTSRARSS